MTAFLDSVRIAKRDAVDDSGRTRAAATVGTAVLALAAAGVAVWQSLLYGSPLITDASGRTSVNPLAVVAPTLALIAVTFVVLVLFGPLAAAWQRFAARRPRIQPAYSARQVARGIGSYAVAVLVVVLAFGGLVVASGYSGSWHTLSERNGQLITGADARVTLTTSDFSLVDSTPVAGTEFLAVDGVTAATPVLSAPVSIGDNDAGRITAIPSGALENTVTTAGGAINTSTLHSAFAGFEQHGIELPAGTTSVSLKATASVLGSDFQTPTSTTGTTQTTLWFQNAAGAIFASKSSPTTLDSIAVGESSTASFTFDLPAADENWWLTAIEYSVRAQAGWVEIVYHDLGVTTSSGSQTLPLDTTTWGDVLHTAFSSGTVSSEDGLHLSLPGDRGRTWTLRMMDLQIVNGPRQGAAYGWPTVEPLRFVVNKDLARKYDVGVGDPFQLRFAGSGLTVLGEIAAVAPAVPGIQSPNAVLVDLNALNDFILRSSSVVPRANQIWLSADAPLDLSSTLPDGATVVTPATAVDNQFAAPAELALWIAAIGCLLLAAISLAAVTLTVARGRRGEIAVLRAVGIAARQQGRWRWGELSAVILLSAVSGVVGGVAVSMLTVPNLARSAVQGASDAVPAALTFTLTTGGALLLASLAVLLGIAAVSAARVRRIALDTSERLETR